MVRVNSKAKQRRGFSSLFKLVLGVALGSLALACFLSADVVGEHNLVVLPDPAAISKTTTDPSSAEKPPQAAAAAATIQPAKQQQHQHHCLNDDFQATQSISVWTMLNDNPQYVQGAIKLGKAIRRTTQTPLDLIVMELQHKPLTASLWIDLHAAGFVRCVVAPIPAPQKTRPDLKEKFAVLHVFAMEVYARVLFLDADTFVQRSLDDLLHMELHGKAVGVTQDIRAREWVDTFNSGVMLLEPSVKEYHRLRELLASGMEFDYVMSDQGFLNAVYKDNWHEIGFVNNANLALYRFKPDFWRQHKLEDITVIHYTMSKPWNCKPNGAYGPVCKVWINAES